MEREELLAREDEAWAALEDVVDKIPETRRNEPGVVPGWTVQDLVWHCAWWARYSGDNMERMAAGTYVHESHNDAYWDNVNARIAKESRTMTWKQVLAGASKARERVRNGLALLPEVTKEAEKDFAGETFGHYEEHTAEIERFASEG
jgi:DinB family protein